MQVAKLMLNIQILFFLFPHTFPYSTARTLFESNIIRLSCKLIYIVIFNIKTIYIYIFVMLKDWILLPYNGRIVILAEKQVLKMKKLSKKRLLRSKYLLVLNFWINYRWKETKWLV